MQFALDPPAGINSDDTTFAATGRWADCDGIRFRGGRAQSIGGLLGLGGTLEDPNKLFVFSQAGETKVAIATASSLQVYVPGSGQTDITPASWGSANTGCSFAMWGDILLVSPTGGTLYQWSGAGLATVISQAPDQITAMLVTNERQVLALGCNEEGSGTFNGLCIRGCDLEDFTDWTTSSTNNAFEHILDSGASIVAASLVAAYVAVWTVTGLSLGQYIGDPSQTYRFDKVAPIGASGLNAVATLGSSVYFTGPDATLYQWAPGQDVAAVPSQLQRDLRLNISWSNIGLLNLCAVEEFGEVWISYPDARDGGTACSRYVVFSARESAAEPVWFRGNSTYVAMADSALLLTDPDLATYGSSLFVAEGTSFGLLTSGADGSGGSWSIQSADFYVNNASQRVMVRGVVTDFEEEHGVDLRLYVRGRPSDTPVAKGPYSLSGLAKADFRASGKLFSVKLSGTGRCRLGKLVFDTVTMGGR